MNFDGKITDVRVSSKLLYVDKWHKRLMVKIGLWLAKQGGYRPPTVPFRTDYWIRQDGKHHHVSVIPADSNSDGAIYLNGIRFRVPDENNT